MSSPRHPRVSARPSKAPFPSRSLNDPEHAPDPLAPEIFRAAIDQADESIVIADLTGRIRYANDAAERLVGRPRQDLLGRHFVVALTGDDSAGRYEHIAQVVGSGTAWSGRHTRTGADGSAADVELVVSPVRDAAGSIALVVAIGRQPTSQPTLESELALEARRRAEIVTTLNAFDPSENVDVRAGQVAEAALHLDGVGLALVAGFGPKGVGHLVASRGVEIGRDVRRWPSRGLVANVMRRSRQRAWIESQVAWDSAGRVAGELRALRMTALGFVPIRHAGQPVGLLLVGTTLTWGVETLERHMPAMVELGAVASAFLGAPFAAREQAAEVRRELDQVITDCAFRSVFQPIMQMSNGAILGYEALTRFSDGSPPEVRFAEAAAIGLGPDLELVTLRSAIHAARLLPAGGFLSLNVSPALVLEGDRLHEVLQSTDRLIVLEITEHEPVADYAALRAAFARIPVPVEWSIDDAGGGYASLRHILELRPQYVKLDRSLISDIVVDPARQALVAGMLHFAQALGAMLIAEGIESDAERLALHALGVSAGQGYLFGRPEPPRVP